MKDASEMKIQDLWVQKSSCQEQVESNGSQDVL